MIYIILGIIIYIISIFAVKRGKEKKYSKARKYFSYHNIRPYPKKNHYKSSKKQNKGYPKSDSEFDNMQKLLRNEQMMEYMMWHNYWSNQ